MGNLMNKAVFLDRDGVINKRRPENTPGRIDAYVTNWEKHWEWAEGAIDGLRFLTQTDYKLIIVSNQSCIGRELPGVNSALITGIFERMCAEIVDFCQLLKDSDTPVYYLCPHAPEDGCACRKPKPGLIYKAAIEHDIDLERSWMVGDSPSDVDAAFRAGIRNIIRIDSGIVLEEPLELKGGFELSYSVDLLAASKVIAYHR